MEIRDRAERMNVINVNTHHWRYYHFEECFQPRGILCQSASVADIDVSA